ncbi:MAG TPA: hypothetical protein VND90_00545 [Terracidiphilus sp.]|nr:hypothetical protein [Terracidiphilus sp.]
MVRSRLFRFAVLAALAALVASTAAMAQDGRYRGRKFKPPPLTSTVTVKVVRKDDGKLIENASVIWHLIGDKGGMELHTNEEGKSMIDILPTGSKVTLQIIAHGYQTYGQVYTISKPTMAIQVELRRPVGQYSIYAHHDIAINGQGSGAQKPHETTKGSASNAAKPDSPKSSHSKQAEKNKPAESAKEDQAQPKPNSQQD